MQPDCMQSHCTLLSIPSMHAAAAPCPRPNAFAAVCVCARSQTGFLWQAWASYNELNVSATHSIIGAIIGFSLGVPRLRPQPSRSCHIHSLLVARERPGRALLGHPQRRARLVRVATCAAMLPMLANPGQATASTGSLASLLPTPACLCAPLPPSRWPPALPPARGPAVYGGLSAVNWATPDKKSFPPYKGVVPIVFSWFFSPILTALAACLIFLLLRTLVLRHSNAYGRSLWVLPIAVLFTSFINVYFIFTKGACKRRVLMRGAVLLGCTYFLCIASADVWVGRPRSRAGASATARSRDRPFPAGHSHHSQRISAAPTARFDLLAATPSPCVRAHLAALLAVCAPEVR
jgi:hypothetical protein